MAEVKWIKIITGIFDDEKVQLIEGMPEADTILVIWFKLLCLAGKTNNSGIIMMSDKIPYTEEMLATIFRRPLNTVRMAMQVFEQYGMVEILNGIVTISNWEKHQNQSRLEELREQKKIAKRKEREQKKLLTSGNVGDMSATAERQDSDSRHLDIEEDIEKERDKDIRDKGSMPSTGKPAPVPAVIEIILNDKSMYPITQQDIDKWAALYPAVEILSELRKMVGWCDANPAKRKTKAGINRFINSWLAREQDKGGNKPQERELKFLD